MLPPNRRAFTLIELLVVVVILAALIGLLLVSVQRFLRSATAAKLAGPMQPSPQAGQDNALLTAKGGEPGQAVPLPLARVQTFTADVVLTPRLSVGTASPESIYEARFTGKTQLVSPKKAAADCELELPLPPQVISLADLSVTVAGRSSEQVTMRNGKVVWHGELAAEPALLEITYSAVGKGLYELSVPPGGILDHFEVSLVADGSDVRLLELSLQPTSLSRSSGTTMYTWDYKRILFGQPVRLDVLGIAPIDRLGELTWLGPISVIIFGLLVGLVVHAASVTRFDRWMLLLTVGTFAAAYPLMYFAQEYLSLSTAVLLATGIALAFIAVRAVTLMTAWLAVIGIILPAATIWAITIVAAIWPSLQGLLLTAEAIGFFIAAMMLIPKIRTATSVTDVP